MERMGNLWVIDHNSLDVITNINDSYISLLWTDRFNECGDFELYMDPTEVGRLGLQKENILYLESSDYRMIIEDFELETDAEDGDKMIITGRSLESILDRRIVWKRTDLDGPIQDAIKLLLEENVINPQDSKRKISNFIFETNPDPSLSDITVTAQFWGEDLLSVIQKLCSQNHIGFHIALRNKQFVFNLYVGVDRSYDQTIVPRVIFSPRHGNIKTSKYVETNSNAKSDVLIQGEKIEDSEEYKTEEYDSTPSITGIYRREIFVDASSVTSDTGNVFDPTNFKSIPLAYIANNKIVGNDRDYTYPFDKLIYIPCTPNVEYTFKRGNTGYTMYIGTSSTEPVAGTAVHNYHNVLNEATQVLTTGPNELWFIIQITPRSYESTQRPQSYFTESIELSGILSDELYSEKLIEKAKEELLDYASIQKFDAEVDHNGNYQYGVDYFIGDIVAFENSYGFSGNERITEVIRSDDLSNGYTVIPTFTSLQEEEENS